LRTIRGWLPRVASRQVPRHIGFCCTLAGLMALLLLPASALAGTAGSIPYVNFPYADQPVMPSHFSPNNLCEMTSADWGCESFNNYVRDIQWSSWGGETAEGTGQVSLVEEHKVKGSTSPVSIVLGGLQSCGGFQVYTTYSLTLAPGAKEPRFWPEGRTYRFPCSLSIAGQYAGQRLGRRANCVFGLNPPTGERAVYSPPASWQPTPPGKRWFLCELHFKSWGKSVAVGSGTVRLGSDVAKGRRYEWPMRIELSRPVWCPASGGYPGAITYSILKVRLRGNDLADAGHHRFFVQRIKPSAEKCRQGWPESTPWGEVI